jgi:uncharacterized protein (TIGR00251 family)
MSSITAIPGGIRIRIHVQPRASRTEIAGRHGDALKIRLAAPPVDGAANEELLGFIAGQLGVSRRAVDLSRGATSREKTVTVHGIAVAAARAALEI